MHSFRVFVEEEGDLSGDWYQLFLSPEHYYDGARQRRGHRADQDIKRMFAYSSIAHAGLRTPCAWWSPGNWEGGGERHALPRHLCLYERSGAFAIVGMLQKGTLESDEIQDFTGLAKREPLAALLMLVFLVSLAGTPPASIGKLYIFMAAVNAGLAWLAVIAVIFAGVLRPPLFLRIVMVMSVGPDPSMIPEPG